MDEILQVALIQVLYSSDCMSTGNMIVLPFTTGAGLVGKINDSAFYLCAFEPFDKRLLRVLWLTFIVACLLKLFPVVVMREFSKVTEWLTCLSPFSEEVHDVMPDILDSKKSWFLSCLVKE